MANDIHLEHKDGIPWWEARVPWWWHKCKAQTIALMPGDYVKRCACGAISGLGARGVWLQRNSRRRDKMRRERGEA